MSTFDLPVTPARVRMEPRANTGLFPSPLLASAQTVNRGGQKWACTLTFPPLRGRNRANMMSLVTKLEGQENRLRVAVTDNPKDGAYGGTPLVTGAAQTGSSLAIDGCTANVTNWIREGDYLSVIVNGEPELKICTADASSDGLGNVTVQFKPNLRASPADNAVIYVEDGVLTRPTGVFLLEEPDAGWDSRPGHPSKVGSFVLNLVEDVWATQA